MAKSGLSHFFKNGMLKKAFIDLLMYFCLSAPRYTTEGKANRHKEKDVCLIAAQWMKL